MFKRRKPEEPPAPPSRGHVIAAGPEHAMQARLDIRGMSGTPATAAGTADAAPDAATDLAFDIPAIPDTPAAPPAAAVPTPPQIKEPTVMSRPPLQPTPISPAIPQGGMSPGMSGLSRTPMAPPRMATPAGERRTLVVGRGISVQGTIQDAERLVVEGTVEANSLNAAELHIAQGGVLKGQVEVEDAEISGLMDGTLTVRGSLVLRGTGQVIGEARCRRLQVEDGGQLSGKISMISEGASAPAPHVPADHDAG